MIVDLELIKKIKSLGLNTYEVKIWTALLSRGVSTAGELSDIANVPRSRSYDVLESLEKKGFVLVKMGKPIKYLAVPPKEVLERVKQNIEDETDQYISSIKSKNFNNLINELQDVYDGAADHVGGAIATLKGKNIRKHTEYLISSAQDEVTVSAEEELAHLDTMERVKADSPKVKLNYFTQTKSDHPLVSVKGPGTRMVVADDHSVIFPFSQKDVHPEYDVAVWIHNRKISQFLKQLVTQ